MPLSPLAWISLAAALGAGLVPSVEDERLERERAVAAEIAKTLELVPGVTAARVHVRLAEKGLLARGAAAEPGAVAVVRVDGRGPDAGMLREIVAAAVPGAAPEQVKVFVTPERADPAALERVGPIEVTRATAGLTRVAIAVALVAIVVLAAGLILAGLRLRRLRRAGGDGAAPR
jgi:type III secretory pathway lipoprotein EscJ